VGGEPEETFVRIAASLLLSLAILLPVAAGADGLTRNVSSLSDAEIDARLAFIEERLDAGETHAKYWQWGWTGVYAAGMAIGTAQAAMTDSGKNRADYITTAVKATIGTTRLLVWRHPGRNGADEIDERLYGNTRSAKERRLMRGEEILQNVAHKAEERWNWKAHAGNIGLNLIGAGFILGFGHATDAAESFGVGVVVGTAHILSAPKRGIQDLEDYQSRFGMKSSRGWDWSITPTLGGAALNVTF
jgi:hypothetical protein